MNVTLTLGEFCVLFIAIALFIFIIYCISLVRHLIPSIKSLAKVMKNVEVVTDCAAKSTESAEAIVSDVMDVTSTLVSSVKGSAGILGLLTSIATAIKSIIDISGNKQEKEEKEKEKEKEKEENPDENCVQDEDK